MRLVTVQDHEIYRLHHAKAALPELHVVPTHAGGIARKGPSRQCRHGQAATPGRHQDVMKEIHEGRTVCRTKARYPSLWAAPPPRKMCRLFLPWQQCLGNPSKAAQQAQMTSPRTLAAAVACYLNKCS